MCNLVACSTRFFIMFYLTIYSTAFLYQYSPFYFQPFTHRITSIKSQASESTEKIEPAVYRKDLYAVLGVTRSSTQREIRDAFWAIAVTSHPDRNSSQEALELFRNASHAYKILGKDQKFRSNYDYVLNAENFANALSEVGSDIVFPLAREVAVPLLNVTVRGIGQIATPFVRNLIEQSKSAIDAATKLTRDDEDVTKNIFEAIAKTRSAQNLRKLTENIEKADSKITDALEELENAVEKQVALKQKSADLSARLVDDNITAISSYK